MFRINIERIKLLWKTSLVLLITIGVIAGWSYYIYEYTRKRAVTPVEAIDFEEKSFFLAHPNADRENTLTTNFLNETAIISITECRKVCPDKYIMSVDCDYCFFFGEWLSNTGDRVSLMVDKEHAVKFCEMHSNGWLPNRQEDLHRIWENPILDQNFARAHMWFGGSWDVETKRYRSDLENKTIENIFVNLPKGNIRKSLPLFSKVACNKKQAHESS